MVLYEASEKKEKQNELVAFVLVDVAVKHIELILCKRF